MTLGDGIGALANRATVVPATMWCGQLEDVFRQDAALRSVVVADGERHGLIMRERFEHVMSGRFGFGHALFDRLPAGEVAAWDVLRVGWRSTVVAVSHRLRTRAESRRYDDILVDLPRGELGLVSAALLFDRLAREFSARAVRDELTGLANRAHFLDMLAASCADATSEDDRVALVFLDLDGLKRINDARGHHAGDAVLGATGRRLRDALGPGELAARLGADEFAVLGRVDRDADAVQAAHRLGRRFLLAVGGPDGAYPPGITVTASVGVAVGGGRPDPQTLLAEADMAMYHAKQAGGAQVEIAVGVEAGLPDDIGIVDRTVAEAIDAGELCLHYQPIVRIRDGAVSSVEALVRWQHPRLGLLPPQRFLPGALRQGHLPALDRWVLRTACADLRQLRRTLGRQAPRRVNVNISTASLGQSFDEIVEEALTAAGLASGQLNLELPEEADLRTLSEAAPRLERLSALGVRLALDDMGTGSTNLRYLSALRIDDIKIDRLFVAGMLDNPRDHAVVKLLADLGHGLGMRVTAEGVERPEQLAALAEVGVTYAQGYHVAPPQPLADLRSLLTGLRPAAAAPLVR
ncbi:putative bifunctional diguanylate cyclase/phosphodiesterase [Hamadaea tsunoensis]|uniref:putative bifunctional diguanylate cyclase/phosphodiesterase n=1 Tax=Hamadaea tsunoensis TaxID=53368 RepID=UPI0003FC6445|nr:EAL domain-containing protein [Hamadaea tsunoensis]